MAENSRPRDDADGRVTAPERYGVLHDAADALIADLVSRYEVTVSTGGDADLRPDGRIELVRSVRLLPSRVDAAPLEIGFTRFPGLRVRFGSWHIQAFPSCGCDACDENPDEVMRQFHDLVMALVEGRFREELVGRLRPCRSAEFVGADSAWRRGSSGRLDRAALRRLEGKGRRDWRPWPRRKKEPRASGTS